MNDQRKTGILPIIHVLAGLILSCLVGGAAPGKFPNIVLIFTDDLGYGDIGTFGVQGIRTPNLDRLAAEGRTFRNFHVAQAVCSASRAALMTGCYPNRIGIHGALGPGSKVALSHDETTMAEIVKQRGYATAIYGKWHLGDAPDYLPLYHGFDDYYGLPYSNDMWPFHPNQVRTGKKIYPDLPMISGTSVANPKVTPKDQEQLTTQYTERAVKFIESNRERPFFLYLAHSMPHVPLFVSDKFRGKSARGIFGDVIEEIDWSVGQVMAAVDRAGLKENTWIIFTSDNGPWLSYGDHAGSALPLREGKGTSWEGGIRTPCIMRWPGKIPAGTETWKMLMTIDILPTVATLLETPFPKNKIDGYNVWPIIAGMPQAFNPHSSYWIYYERGQLQSVISGDGQWKLVLPHTYRTLAGKKGGTGGLPVEYTQETLAQPKLFQITNQELSNHEGIRLFKPRDISETTDVSKDHPDILERLLKEAEKAREELGDALQKRVGKGVRAPGQTQG